MPEDLAATTLRLPGHLLKQVTDAAKASHMDRSSWIRMACAEKLAGPDPSRNTELIAGVEVVDERARAIVRDLIARVERLEAAQSGKDPFS